MSDINPLFPKSPFEIIDPELRWFPGDAKLREQAKENDLLPPLVTELRKRVKLWRDRGYEGASLTSQALLEWWFKRDHIQLDESNNTRIFQYYFAQREAVETVIYLYDCAKARDPRDLLLYSDTLSRNHFIEDWLRVVIKMATGSGKTKVLSLLITWSYYHKLYEEDSELARNFLVNTSNIIVLERIRNDFDGLKIFFDDPMIPENGFMERNWEDDFQLKLHIQDEVKIINKTGNIFLTNIHRVYQGEDKLASFEDEDTTEYFLGAKAVAKTNDSTVDLGKIVRDIDELVILNDEAHHIHNDKLAWFRSIRDIHHALVQKGFKLPLQIDLTATPKDDQGRMFPQVVSDYPLVEAIYQNIVKNPVIPDAASCSKLKEHHSDDYTEKYRDYLDLGYEEWRKAYHENQKLGKKSLLFVMTDDTKNCDKVAEYLMRSYSEFADPNSVLVIHTKDNGDIKDDQKSLKSGELEKLREAANSVDRLDNSYKAVVSVMMLKEGWDVRNVTTIVGLRSYSAASKILPEQTLGRGLRRMYPFEDIEESLSIIGTEKFMDVVKSLTREDIKFKTREMGVGSPPKAPLVVEVDKEKDLESLDIQVPVMSPAYIREFKNLSELDPSKFSNSRLTIKSFSEEELREIVFRDLIDDREDHKTVMTSITPDANNVIAYLTRAIMRELRLVSGYDSLYGKVKLFISCYLFTEEVDLEDANVLRNLSETVVYKTIFDVFRREINDLTIRESGDAEISNYIQISKTKTFSVKDQGYLVSKKTVFNRVVGDSGFELEFAGFLESCDDIQAYMKNHLRINFKIDYCKASGEIADYHPDFVVKVNPREICVVETKGVETANDISKIQRLKIWCQDLNRIQSEVKYSCLYIKQEDWNNLPSKPKTFRELENIFVDK